MWESSLAAYWTGTSLKWRSPDRPKVTGGLSPPRRFARTQPIPALSPVRPRLDPSSRPFWTRHVVMATIQKQDSSSVEGRKEKLHAKHIPATLQIHTTFQRFCLLLISKNLRCKIHHWAFVGDGLRWMFDIIFLKIFSFLYGCFSLHIKIVTTIDSWRIVWPGKAPAVGRILRYRWLIYGFWYCSWIADLDL